MRVIALLSDVQDLMSDMSERIKELQDDLGVSDVELVHMLTEAAPPNLLAQLRQVGVIISAALSKGVDGQAVHRGPCSVKLDKLLAEAPKAGDTDAPAIECAVIIDGFVAPVNGVLSRDADGYVKMLSPVSRTEMVEQFFLESDVRMIAIKREVKATAAPPRIYTAP